MNDKFNTKMVASLLFTTLVVSGFTYAATTITDTSQTVVNNDIMSAAWFNDVNSKLASVRDKLTSISNGTANALIKYNASGNAMVSSQIYENAGNVGIGVTSASKKLEVNGAIMADEVCIRGKNECVKTFQQSLSNTQYFNFRNDNPYGGPGSATNLLYDSKNETKTILPQGPVYLRADTATLNAVGIDPNSNGKKSNWFAIANSYMQPYEGYPRAIFVDQGDNMSIISDQTINGPVAGNTNVYYCVIKRLSDGYEYHTSACDVAPSGQQILYTYVAVPATNHAGILGIEYRLIGGVHRECDTVNWSPIMQNRSWGDPEVTNVRSTQYQSPPDAASYPKDYCGSANMHSQIAARFVLSDYNTVSAGSLAQFIADSPRTIKIKSIGISLLR